VLKIKQE